jgi:quercetin dioxygenase-like cupin family protein
MALRTYGVEMARTWGLPLVVGIAIGVTGMQIVHAQSSPVTATRLRQADLTGVAGKEVIMTIIEAQPGAGFPAHFHHGDEFVYVIEGTYERFIEQTHAVAKQGESFHIEREKVHGGNVGGTAPAKLLTVHVVDKGKPLVERVKQ